MYFTQLLWLLNTNSDIDQLSASVSAYVIRMYIFRQPAFSDCLFYCCQLCNVYLLTCLPAPKSLFDRSWFLSPLYTLHKYSVCVCVCVKECEMFKLSPSVFVCHHPHTHSRSYFYSRLALCHITWQRGSPPVEHACSTCKNTTTAQRKYLTSLKKKTKKKRSVASCSHWYQKGSEWISRPTNPLGFIDVSGKEVDLLSSANC